MPRSNWEGFFWAHGKIDEAQEKASLVLQEDPQNVEATILQSAICLARNETAQARTLMEGLLNRGERTPGTYIMLALALKQSGDSAAEESALQKGISVNPRSINLYLMLADHHMRQKRMDEAIADMKNIIAIEPASLRYRISLARMYWESNKAAEAADVLKGITSANASSEDSWIQTSGFYIIYGKHEDAERELKAGINQNKKSFKLRLALSELYLNTGRTDQAITVLKECLSLSSKESDPNIIQAKNMLARIALSRYLLAEAKTYVDEVLKASSKNTDAIFTRGSIYLFQGDVIKAIADFRTVVTDKPQFIPGHIRLAEAHRYNGEPNLAIDTLKTALRIDPKSRELNRALGQRICHAEKSKGSGEPSADASAGQSEGYRKYSSSWAMCL